MNTSQLFDSFSEPRRRHVVYTLVDAEGPLAVEELATRVTDIEGGQTDPAQVERVHLTLVHNHLPRLTDAGLVEYDEANETVAIASVSEPVRDLIEAARALDAER